MTGRRKLTNTEAAMIRRRFIDGEPIRVLAEEHGLSYSCIRDTLRFLRYREAGIAPRQHQSSS